MLKYTVDSLEGIPEQFVPLYEKVDESTFRLNVDGAAPREKLDEFRNNNIDLLKKLESYKGVDVKEYQRLSDLAKKIDEKQLIDAGKVDEVVTARVSSMKAEHDGVVSEMGSKLEQANRQLESLLIDSAVRVKALESGVLPTAVDDIMLRAKLTFKIIDGQAVPHADNKPVYGKDGVNPMSVEEWISGLSKTAPHLFGSTQGGGASGSRPGSRGAGGAKLSSVQKIAAGLGGR